MSNIKLKLLLILTLAFLGPNVRAEQLVKWEGLCIPKERISWLQPGGGPQFSGPFAEALLHLKSDAPGWNTPGAGVTFSGEEIAKAIPGYLATAKFKLSGGSPIFLHLGSVVSIDPASNTIPISSPDSVNSLRNLWNMTGKWAGAKVTQLPGSPYYEVHLKDKRLRGFGDYAWTLVKIDLVSKNKRDVTFLPIANWYVGTCGVRDPSTPSMGFTCERAMIGTTFRIHYSVDGKNINFIDQFDKFIGDHIVKWVANCNTISK